MRDFLTAKELAKKHHVPYQTTINTLRRLKIQPTGVRFTGRKGAPPQLFHKKYGPIILAEYRSNTRNLSRRNFYIVALWNGGHSYGEIAKKFNLTSRQVGRVLASMQAIRAVKRTVLSAAELLASGWTEEEIKDVYGTNYHTLKKARRIVARILLTANSGR